MEAGNEEAPVENKVIGHRCKRWDPDEKQCLFRTLGWHGTEPYFDEQDVREDEQFNWRNVNSIVATPYALMAYASLLKDYQKRGPENLRAGSLLQYRTLYNAAVGLAEIGVTEQLRQHVNSQKDTSKREVTPSPGGINWPDVPAWMSGAISGSAAVATAIIIARGAKGGAFRTSLKYGWDVRGRGPLWSVTVGVAELLGQGYVASGTEVVKETASPGGPDFGVGSAFAHGITGYI